jgi:hypothetical protein
MSAKNWHLNVSSPPNQRTQTNVGLDALHRENLVRVFNHWGLRGIPAAELDEPDLGWHRMAP